MSSSTAPTLRQLGASLRVFLVLSVVLGIGYPLVMTGLAQLLFPHQADGSLVDSGDRVVGSSLVGQSVSDPAYFLPRPSEAGEGYDPLASSASNLGPENHHLVDLVEERRAAVAELEDVDPSTVPPDALLASGSGLDPHISPAYADVQVPRVARERGLPVPQVRALVRQHTDGRSLGFLGEPRVNVLLLNLALDDLTRAQGGD